VKTACWTLFGLSLLVSLLGAVSRFGTHVVPGIEPTTYWKVAMALLAYAVSLRILAFEEKRPT
jgi:hypothetical protein